MNEDTNKSKSKQHIDDWLNMPVFPNESTKDNNLAYAKFVLDYMRLPAHKQMSYREFMKDKNLFCTYCGERYRVNMASRMGDIGLAKNHKVENGYTIRVAPEDCSMWSDKP